MTELQQTIDAWMPEAFGPVSEWGLLAGVFLASTIVFFLIARMFVRRGRAEDESLDEPQGQGVFGPLTPALAAQIPESKKGRRDFGKLLRSAGIYSPTAKTTIYALRFVLLFVPLAYLQLKEVAESFDLLEEFSKTAHYSDTVSPWDIRRDTTLSIDEFIEMSRTAAERTSESSK